MAVKGDPSRKIADIRKFRAWYLKMAWVGFEKLIDSVRGKWGSVAFSAIPRQRGTHERQPEVDDDIELGKVWEPSRFAVAYLNSESRKQPFLHCPLPFRPRSAPRHLPSAMICDFPRHVTAQNAEERSAARNGRHFPPPSSRQAMIVVRGKKP